MKLVVGLGNPGKEYINTRHNIGFYVLDNYLGDVKWSKKFNGLYYEKTIDSEKYLFLKPQSYMNLSGGVVSRFVNYFDIAISDILVIQDDLDLEIGDFRLKHNSSSGGHNGIKDIINALNSNEFVRLKVGISHNRSIDTKDYVLGEFSKSELQTIESLLPSFYDIIENFSQTNLDRLMSKYN